MSESLLRLAAANVLMLGCGAGLLPLLGLARSRRELVARLPLAYAVGLGATGVLAVELTLIGVGLSPLIMSAVALLALGLGLPGLPSGCKAIAHSRPRWERFVLLVPLAVLAGLAVEAVRTAAIEPLSNPLAWPVAIQARALLMSAGPGGHAFTDHVYLDIGHPLLLPALEATDFRFIGSFDPTLIHLQLLGFALALLGGAWSLARNWTSPLVLAAVLVAAITTPAFLDDLLANTTAVPLACFVALGVVPLALWLRRPDPGLLPAAVLFLGAATLTDPAGDAFALAALLTAWVAAPLALRRRLAGATLVLALLVLPWRIWLLIEGVAPSPGGLTAGGLWHAVASTRHWGYASLLLIVGLAAALLRAPPRLGLFVAGWAALSVGCLLALRAGTGVAVASAADGLLVAGLVLTPLLLSGAPDPLPVAASPRVSGPLRAPAAALALRARSLPLAISFRPAPGAATVAGVPWRRPRRELLLLALVAVVTLTPVEAISSQDLARLCLSQALTHLRVSADSCLSSPFARDKSVYHGHLYSDKAPGMSVLEIPAAVATRLPPSSTWSSHPLRLWVARIIPGGLAFIVSVFLVGRIGEGLAPGRGGLALVAFGLGTLGAALAAGNFEHVTAGALGVGAFLLAWQRRPVLAGLAAGIAVDVAYEAAIILAIVGAYLLVKAGRRPLVDYALGAVPGVVLLGLYDWWAWGDPFRVSYVYKSSEFAAQQSSGFFGIHLPYAHAISLVFVGRGGLLVISPIVVAAGYGLVRMARAFPAEAAVCAAVSAAFVFLECGYFDPYGGLSPGPRFLVPALPFLALGLGPAFLRRPWLTTALTLLSVVPMTALTLTWSMNAPNDGSIWNELARVPHDLGHSWIASNLSPNILEWLGAGSALAALLVALAAACALVLALPLSWSRRETQAPARVALSRRPA